MFDALTDEKIVSTYTQVKATIEAKVGGKFKLFDGSIEGEFVEFEAGKKLVEKWRMKEYTPPLRSVASPVSADLLWCLCVCLVRWPENHYSIVTITFTQKSSNVVALELKQTGIPLEDKYGHRDVADKVKLGWNNFFWMRINKIVGYLSVDLGKADDDD